MPSYYLTMCQCVFATTHLVYAPARVNAMPRYALAYRQEQDPTSSLQYRAFKAYTDQMLGRDRGVGGVDTAAEAAKAAADELDADRYDPWPPSTDIRLGAILANLPLSSPVIKSLRVLHTKTLCLCACLVPRPGPRQVRAGKGRGRGGVHGRGRAPRDRGDT